MCSACGADSAVRVAGEDGARGGGAVGGRRTKAGEEVGAGLVPFELREPALGVRFGRVSAGEREWLRSLEAFVYLKRPHNQLRIFHQRIA